MEKKEAMKILKDFHDKSALFSVRTALDTVFPEFVESEDERIRKGIIQYLEQSQFGEEHYQIDDDIVRNYIDWLEKQGGITKLSEEEQNRFAKGVLTSCALSFIDYLDAHKYEGKMCVSNGECEDIENAFHNAMWDRLHRYYCKYIEKQGEQKFEQKFFINDKVVHKATGKIWTIHYYLKDTNSYYVEDNDGLLHHYRESELKLVEQKPTEWSEEDERNIKELMTLCDGKKELCTKSVPEYVRMDELKDWLKSFKDRHTWKPSKEQIMGIDCAIKTLQHQLNVEDKRLNSLYDDLKKLKD